MTSATRCLTTVPRYIAISYAYVRKGFPYWEKSGQLVARAATSEATMRPKQAETANDDLFRSSLETILDPGHELIRLVDWERFDDAFGVYYHDRKGRRGLRTRLTAGLHRFEHMKGLSDEELCAAWIENPY